jgi:hypothetical protein
MDKFNDALISLDSIKREFEIFVPSANKKVKFKGLTTKQQKDAVKSALDKSFAGISFALFANDVIRENSTENISFLVSDRSYLITALRVVSLNKIYKKENEEIDLSFITNNNFSLPDDLKSTEIVEEGVKVLIKIPTLIKDSQFNTETRKKLLPLADNDDLPKEAVGEVFIHELAKYIDTISIDINSKPVEITFNELTINQKVQVLEKLPVTINNKIIEFINKVKAFEKTYFVNGDKQIEIDIDPTLFTV